MRIKRAVILAAGSGSRLGTLTAGTPKALIDVCGRTLIDRQLDALQASGVRDVTVVVGHQHEQLRRHLGHRVSVVRNDCYRETNSLYSLWLAADHLKGGGLVLDGDVLFTPLLIDRLRWHPAPDALLYDPERALGPEQMKVRLAGPYVIDMGTQLCPGLAAGEGVGIVKFGSEGSARLARILDELVTAGQVTALVPRAVTELAHRWPIVAVDVDGLPWTEVDCPEDLHYAEQVIADVEASLPPPLLLGDSHVSQAQL